MLFTLFTSVSILSAIKVSTGISGHEEDQQSTIRTLQTRLIAAAGVTTQFEWSNMDLFTTEMEDMLFVSPIRGYRIAGVFLLEMLRNCEKRPIVLEFKNKIEETIFPVARTPISVRQLRDSEIDLDILAGKFIEQTQTVRNVCEQSSETKATFSEARSRGATLFQDIQEQAKIIKSPKARHLENLARALFESDASGYGFGRVEVQLLQRIERQLRLQVAGSGPKTKVQYEIRVLQNRLLETEGISPLDWADREFDPEQVDLIANVILLSPPSIRTLRMSAVFAYESLRRCLTVPGVDIFVKDIDKIIMPIMDQFPYWELPIEQIPGSFTENSANFKTIRQKIFNHCGQSDKPQPVSQFLVDEAENLHTEIMQLLEKKKSSSPNLDYFTALSDLSTDLLRYLQLRYGFGEIEVRVLQRIRDALLKL